MADVRQRSFLLLYDVDCRLRHRHTRIKRQIVHFVVQLEVLRRGRWHAVVRYDTAHGFAHRDLVHPSGRVEKFLLPSQDFNEALTYAELDLDANWIAYRERFLQEVSDHG